MLNLDYYKSKGTWNVNCQAERLKLILQDIEPPTGLKISLIPFKIRSLLNIQWTAKYTKEILKNTKKKSEIRIFQFLALKIILKYMYDCWLHSRGPNASFDTNIDIYTYGLCQSTIHFIYVINVKYDIYDIDDIWHLTYIHMSIWVSKEVLGPQVCSQPS